MKYIYFRSFIGVFTLLLCTSQWSISQEDDVLMPYLRGERYGFANSEGEIVVEPKYDFVMPFNNGFSYVRLNYKWGIIEQNGKELLEPIAKQVSPFDENGLSVVNIDGKYGVINANKKWILPLEYAWIELKSGFIQVRNDERKVALFTTEGKVLTDFKYDYFRLDQTVSLGSNHIITQEDSKYGLIEIEKNKKSVLKIVPQYKSLRGLTEELLVAKQNDHLGLVNVEGEVIVPFEYSEFKMDGGFIIAEKEIPYKVKFRIVELDNAYYMRRWDEIEREYDEENKIVYNLVTQDEYDRITSFNEELRTDDLRMISVFNKKGECIIAPQLGEIRIDQHFIQARTIQSEVDAETTLYFKNGTTVSPIIFHAVDEVHEGLVLVKFLSEQETLKNAYELPYEERALHFNNRFKYGFMDSTGEWVLPPEYNGAFAFNQGRAPVRKAFKWALINKKGEQLTEFKYDQLYVAGENRYAFRQGKKWGLMDLNGQEIIPATYYEYQETQYAADYFGGYSGLVFKNGKALTSKQLPSFRQQHVSIIDTNGVQLFPFKYISIEEPIEGMFIVAVKNHNRDRQSYGLINRDGEVLIPAYQDYISWRENEEVFIASPEAYRQNYTYYDRNGQRIDSPFKAIEREDLRDYKLLPNGYFTAKWKQFNVYFTPEGVPLFEK